MLKILLLLLPVVSFAGPHVVINCVIDNQPVTYYQLPHSDFVARDMTDAMSGINVDGERLIAYDDNLLTEPPAYFNAVISHECSHHKLGHLSDVMTKHIDAIQHDDTKMLAMHLSLELSLIHI